MKARDIWLRYTSVLSLHFPHLYVHVSNPRIEFTFYFHKAELLSLMDGTVVFNLQEPYCKGQPTDQYPVSFNK